jgi:uncharacterized membrane protein (UPF0127 family)
MAEQKQYNNRNRNNNRNNNNRNNNNRNRNNNNRNRNQGNNRNSNRNNPHGGGKRDHPAPPPPEQQESNNKGGKASGKSQSKTESSRDLIIFIVFLLALSGFFLARKFYFPPEKNALYGGLANTKFMKEGKLSFRNAESDEIITNIDIEIAKSNYEIEQGLMYRRSLPANGGMLFVFPQANYRTFWMKNTFLSLDILFVNEDKEIIRICKNATPLSEVSIPSGGKAQYVVEVLAGFTDAYEIHLGDRIDF